MKPRLVAIFLLAAGMAWLTFRERSSGGGMTLPASGQAPAWTLHDLDGHEVRADQFSGRVVLLNFWATYCPPCRQEIPELIRFSRETPTNTAVILGVSTDESGAAVVRPFATARGINYPMLLADSTTLDQFGGVSAIPTTFVIDAQGNLRFRHLGTLNRTQLAKLVAIASTPRDTSAGH